MRGLWDRWWPAVAGFMCGVPLVGVIVLHAELSALEARLERQRPAAAVDCPAPAATSPAASGEAGRP